MRRSVTEICIRIRVCGMGIAGRCVGRMTKNLAAYQRTPPGAEVGTCKRDSKRVMVVGVVSDSCGARMAKKVPPYQE